MKRAHGSNKMQKQILAITLSCILIMCVVISFVSYYIFRNYLQHSLIQSTGTSLGLLTDTINGSTNDIYRIVRFCQTNSDVAKYVEIPNPDSVLSYYTYDRLTEEYNNNPSNTYISRMAVVSGEKFLQVVSASYSSTANLAAEIPNLPFFEDLLTDSTYNFSTGFIDDPFHRKRRKVIPIIRPITYQYNSIQGGYLFLEISDELFTDPLKRYDIAEDSHVFLTIDGHRYLYEDGHFSEYTDSYEVIEGISDLSLTRDISAYRVRNSEGDISIVLTSPLNMKDCFISQTISQTELLNQRTLFGGLLIGMLIVVIGIGIILMFILNRMINVPVLRIRDKMVKISRGDFSRDNDIEWQHELGDIGRGINDLSENVVVLMERRLEDEKQKRDLEYKMLQSQINPHFLYNTLNSIKWMAVTQGADGISEMTTALSRLLRSISKGTSLLVSIREELSLIEDYFTIQRYRYGGTISMEITVEEDSLYESQIVKFTLQPLVENAIFHGIEPKGTVGKITIHVYYVKEDLSNSHIRIDVTDDGVGMSEEKARQILSDHQETGADFFREIGVSNVQKRLQYEFGEQYGITIKSVEGSYTTMSIHIPYRKNLQEGEADV